MASLWRLVTGSACLLVCGAAAAQGQDSSTLRASVGGGVGLGVLATDANSGWGPEASVRVGYVVAGTAQLFARVRYGAYQTRAFTEDDSWSLWSTDVGIRLHLARIPRGWTPYVEVAGAFRKGTVEAIGAGFNPSLRDWDLDGGALVLGAGALVFVRDGLSLDVGGNFTRGSLQNPRDDDPWMISTGALAVGLSWWP